MENVLELRQYTLRPGQRDVLIDLFDREFLDPLEAAGMRMIGQFRDLDDANRFVWMRAFPDMESRTESLRSFYYGPIWQAHRDVANATMVDSDNVLLLRPVLEFPVLSRPGDPTTSMVLATIYYLDRPVDDDFIDYFQTEVDPIMTEASAPPVAYYQTEYAENTFPALPVRTGEHAFVWFTTFDSVHDHDEHLSRLSESDTWQRKVLPGLTAHLSAAPEHLRLAPTPRSALR